MKHGDLLVVVVDGQGGGMGRGLVESIKKKWPKLHVRAVGTNSLATSAMLRAGADDGATGENAVVFNARQADLLLGPIGILTPNGLLGEVSPAMQWPMWAVYSTMLIGFALNGAETASKGTTEALALTGDWTVPLDGKLPLTYDAVVSALSQPVDQQVISIVFVLEWA